MKTSEQYRANIVQELAELRAYRTTQPVRQLLKLLDALIADHMADLVTVAPEQLQLKQGAVRQLTCLHNAICQDGPHLWPKP